MNLLQSIKNTFNKFITMLSCSSNQDVVLNDGETIDTETKDEMNDAEMNVVNQDENKITESENHGDTSEFVFNEVASNNEYDI
jgi:hypothetical protein